MRPQPRRCADALLVAFAALPLWASPALAQTRVADDAKRTVTVPAHVSRVFAAGAPAEVLLYTLVPDMLVGRNHMPTAAALELMPPELRMPKPIKNLPDRDDPRYDEELLALKPDVYIDYGTVDDDYVAALDAISGRTKTPALIFDGRLTAIPTIYRKLGAALGVADRGEKLAAEAQRLLDKYRNAAASVRVYLACSRDSLMPCVQGHPFGEAAELLGAINTGGSTATAPKRPLDGPGNSFVEARRARRREPRVRRHHAQRSRMARGRCGRARTRLLPTRSAVQLGPATPVGEPAARRNLDGLRATRATVRRRVLRRFDLGVRDVLSLHADERADRKARRRPSPPSRLGRAPPGHSPVSLAQTDGALSAGSMH